MNSKNADVQNINYVGAGQQQQLSFYKIYFKQNLSLFRYSRYGFLKYGGALNSGGATGFGVRLLNQLIEENYE